MVVQRRLGAEIPSVVDVLELSEDVDAWKYIHGDIHKSQLCTETQDKQHIQKCTQNKQVSSGHVAAGILT